MSRSLFRLATCIALIPASAQTSWAGALDVNNSTITYSQLLLRARPQDDATRRALVRSLTDAGRWTEAHQVLAPLLEKGGETARTARLDALEITSRQVRSLGADRPERSVLVQSLTRQIERVQAESLDAALLERMAGISLEVSAPALAARIYQRLANMDAPRRAHWLALAGHQHLAGGSPGLAATAYQDASRAAHDVVGRRKYALLALDAMVASADGARALRLAKERLGDFADDMDFLQRAVDIAMGQNDLQWAQSVGQQLLKLDPANVQQRIRQARIADWSGQPESALEQWLALARTTPTPEVLDRAMRNAQALERDDVWLKLAQQASAKRPLSAQEQQDLGRIVQRGTAGGPLIAFLQDYGARNALTSVQWQALANAHEQLGDLPAALNVWQGLRPGVFSPVVLASQRARLLSALRRPQDAWSALRAVQASVPAGDHAFWQTYADLAWECGAQEEALANYAQVWSAGAQSAQVPERLMAGYSAHGATDAAVAVGVDAYLRLDHPRWLLLAMDTAAQAQRWDLLRTVSDQAQGSEARFADSEMYWLLQAHLARHDHDPVRAHAAYTQALALNPQADATRVQLVWTALETGEDLLLLSELAQWQDQAQDNADYWHAYAMGRLRLKQLPASVHWFGKAVQAQPDDIAFQSAYLQTLFSEVWDAAPPDGKTGLLEQLKTMLIAPGAEPHPKKLAVLLNLESLVRAQGGADSADAVLADMLAAGYDDAEIYRRLVDSSLARNNTGNATEWLQRAQLRQHTLPAYQSLAVALNRKDLSAISLLLQERGDELGSADRVSALRRLQRNTQALALAEQALLQEPIDTGGRLAAHRDALRVQQRSDFELGYSVRDLSDLLVQRAEASASFALEAGRVRLRLAHNTLSGDDVHVSTTGIRDENDVALTTETLLQDDPLRFTIGANARTDKDLFYADLDWTRALTTATSVRVGASVHSLSDLSPALRLVGSQDKLTLGLSSTLSQTLDGRLAVAAHQFTTRSGASLGQGYRAEGALEKTLVQGSPSWRVRVAGSTENNILADALPPELVGTVLLPPVRIDDVVPRNFSTLGAGATLQIGTREGATRQTYGLLDVWAGRQWPASESAYAVRASMHIPVSANGRGVVRLEAHYTNVMDGTSDKPDRGIGVVWQHSF